MLHGHREKKMRHCALITGASSGIGASFAHSLAKQGYNILLVARREDKLRRVQSDLQIYGVEVDYKRVDLLNPEARQSLCNEIRGGYELDMLVNNAGFGLHGIFHQQSRVDLLCMIETNISALLDLTHELLPHLLRDTEGDILSARGMKLVTGEHFRTEIDSVKTDRSELLNNSGGQRHREKEIISDKGTAEKSGREKAEDDAYVVMDECVSADNGSKAKQQEGVNEAKVGGLTSRDTHTNARYILNIASVGAFLPGPFYATYYASKAFVLSFTEAIAEEVRFMYGKKSQLKVSVLCPGPIQSEFFEKVGFTATQSKHVYKMMRKAPSADLLSEFALKKLFRRNPPVVIIYGKIFSLMVLFQRVMSRKTIRRISAKAQALRLISPQFRM